MGKAPVENIRFHFQVEPFYFPERTALKGFLSRQLKKEKRVVEAINYIFCSDSYLLEMNQQFLKHETLTDIITFELSPKGHPLLADIFISVERVRENASLFGTSFRDELHRVIFHGALHLLGYKDKNAEQSKLMRSMENNWLKEYFVPRETKRR